MSGGATDTRASRCQDGPDRGRARRACVFARVALLFVLVLGWASGLHADPARSQPDPRARRHPTAGPPASCPPLGELPGIAKPWGGFKSSATAAPEEPGYAELFEFVTGSEGQRGRAIVVRLTSDDGARSVYPGDIRRWAVVVETPAERRVSVSYDFVDAGREAFFAHVDPRLTRRLQFTHPVARELSARERLCLVAGATGHATRVEVVAHARGDTHSRGELRDLLESPLRRRGR